MGPDTSTLVVTNFLWSVFTANLGYVLLAFIQKRYAKTYPALRHHSDPFSLIIIVVHMLCGATVVYGGCAIHWSYWRYVGNRIIPTWAAQTVAVAAIAHSFSNLFLLRKIPGVRVFNVPLYVFSTVYNAHRARCVLVSISSAGPDLREILLLWCAVSTYVWVRYFIFVFGTLTGLDPVTYCIVYTLALPYAAVLGIVVPAALLGGVDDRWTFALVAAVAALGPPMIGLHRVCVRVRDWPLIGRWGPCRWTVQILLDSTNPVMYHGQAFQASQEKKMS